MTNQPAQPARLILVAPAYLGQASTSRRCLLAHSA